MFVIHYMTTGWRGAAGKQVEVVIHYMTSCAGRAGGGQDPLAAGQADQVDFGGVGGGPKWSATTIRVETLRPP